MNADAQNQELMRLYRIRKTVLKLLTKRGYNVLEQTLEATFQSFSDDVARISLENNNCTAREACTINVGKIDDATDVVFVFFSDDEKGLGTKPIQKYVERLLQAGSNCGIIVYRNNITAIAKKLLMPGAIPGVRLEVFKESELLVDITEHTLVPEHVVLTPDQKQEVLTRYKLKESQLPKIQAADPIARYYGLQRGTVVKIIRRSETAGRYITYRVCV